MKVNECLSKSINFIVMSLVDWEHMKHYVLLLLHCSETSLTSNNCVMELSQPTFTSSKSTMETAEHSLQKNRGSGSLLFILFVCLNFGHVIKVSAETFLIVKFNFLLKVASLHLCTLHLYDPKQPSRGVPRKRCSENMPQIYRRTPMPKCDFNKVALQLY